MTHSLPRGWASVRLGDQVYLAGRIGWRGLKADEYVKQGPLLLSTFNLNYGDAVDYRDANHITRDRYDESPEIKVQENDILLTKDGAGIGKLGLVRELPEEATINSSLLLIRARESLLPEYLFYALKGPRLQGIAQERITGSTTPHLFQRDIKEFELGVAPLNEQRRIVAKLEALQARSRRAREALDAVPPLLEKLRQSILAAAFRGDLTKDWRAQNPNTEPASALLARIRTERRKKWEESELAKLKAKGKPPTDDRWKAKYKEPEPVDTTGLPELPEGWCWARAEEVCDVITKGTTPGAAEFCAGAGVPFIKVYNLTFDARVDFTVEPSFVDRATHEGVLARSRLLPGDVLMNIVGPPLGKVGIVPSDYPEWNMNQAVAVFRVLPGVEREYLARHLLSSRTVQWAVGQAKATAGQLNLTLEICRDLPVPICSREEQVVIVQAIENGMRAANSNADLARSCSEKLLQFERAVLGRAFRGELVPQDPDDEPAEVTLSRLRADSAFEPPRPRGRRSKAAE